MEDNQKQFKENQLVLWKEMILDIFGEIPSTEVTIKGRQNILKVLDIIGRNSAENHTFMPSGGGSYLSGAQLSRESELIELDFGGIQSLVYPASLTFYPTGDNPEWWYFRLNTGKFNPANVDDHYSEGEKDTRQELFPWSAEKDLEWSMQYIGEEVLDIGHGEYLNPEYKEVNNLGYDEDGNAIPLPKESRIVTRMFNGGAYVIFPEYSIYHASSLSYDAGHNIMDSEKFQNYISEIEKKIRNS